MNAGPSPPQCSYQNPSSSFPSPVPSPSLACLSSLMGSGPMLMDLNNWPHPRRLTLLVLLLGVLA